MNSHKKDFKDAMLEASNTKPLYKNHFVSSGGLIIDPVTGKLFDSRGIPLSRIGLNIPVKGDHIKEGIFDARPK